MHIKSLIYGSLVGLAVLSFQAPAAPSEAGAPKKNSPTESLIQDESIKGHVEKALKSTIESTQQRLDANSHESAARLYDAELLHLNSQMTADESEFIHKNVPPEVRILGKKAVERYITEHFTEPKKEEPKAPVKEVESVWKSQESTLVPIIPTAQTVLKTPVPQAVPTPTAVKENVQPDLSPSDADLINKAKNPHNKTNKKTKKQQSASPKISFEITKVVVMGDFKSVDILASLNRGDASAEDTYNDLQEGSSFVINKIKYTVDAIDKMGTTITDQNKKSYRVTLN